MTETTEITEKQCNICFEKEIDDDKITDTPCHHKFHITCLKHIQKPECPLCRKDLSKDLINMGLNKCETKTIVKRKLYTEHITNIDMLADAVTTHSEFIQLCLRTYKLSEKGIKPYINVLIEKIKKGSKLFHDIYTKCNEINPNGMFYYHFNNIREFISYLSVSNHESRLKWLKNDRAKYNKTFAHLFGGKNRYNDKNKFYVCINIDNVECKTYSFDKNSYKTIRPISLHEVIQCLLYCDDKRCDCDRTDTSNMEYDEAKRLLYCTSKKTLPNFIHKSFFNKDTEIKVVSHNEIDEMMDSYFSDMSSDGSDFSEDDEGFDVLPKITKKNFNKIKSMITDIKSPLLYTSYKKWQDFIKECQHETTRFIDIIPAKLIKFCDDHSVQLNIEAICNYALYMAYLDE